METDHKLFRKLFFNDYWQALESNGWDSVILHSWRKFPDIIDSDVDYAMSGCSPAQLLRFLSTFCRERNWRLVQVIEHEPGAFFCVCIHRSDNFQQIALDVTWDYRRLGHILLRSCDLMEDRRLAMGKTFYVPSPGREAVYIIAKAAAKGKIFEDISTSLIQLHADNPEDFCKCLNNLLGCPLSSDWSSKQIIQEIKRWFPSTQKFEAIRSGRRFGFAEISLYIRRCLHPTGLWLSVRSDTSTDDSQLIEAITAPIQPLFRRVFSTAQIGLSKIPKTISQVIRTSLVIENSSKKSTSSNKWKFSLRIPISSNAKDISLQLIDHLGDRVDQRLK